MRLARSILTPFLFAFFGSVVVAQDSAPRAPLVHDWSSRHVIFSGLQPENVAATASADPRAWHSWFNHSRHHFESPEEPQIPPHRRHRHHRELVTDWQVPISTGVGPRVFPAKFSFDVNAAPDCVNDFVVFPTDNSGVPGASGSGVSASLVAFNNLYTGPGPTGICPTAISPAIQPSVLFAYNTSTINAGRAYLSPILSLDGKKIAFVESNSGSGSNFTALHVLTWKAGEGNLSGAAAPGDCSPGNSCMASVVLSTVRSNSSSNPFIDYAGDIAYVGDDGGLLHKIIHVFSGTPAEVTANGWPIQLHPPFGSILNSPVLDSVSARIFVTDNTGALYVVNAATATILKTISLTSFTPSDPIVDSTDQTVFVFSADSSFNLSVWQFDTAGNQLRKLTAGTLSGDINVFTGTFDNNYFLSPATGSLYFAGAVNGVASLYNVGFAGKTMNSTFSGPLVLSTSTTTSVPTPLTELFNPSFASAHDRLFLGIDANCANGSTNGCIESFDISAGFPSAILSSHTLGTNGASLSVSGIIIDNVSSLAQASSIYFESLSVSSTVSAIKLTQSALQ